MKLTDAHWTAPAICGCGEPDCVYLVCGYPFCPGCGDHHRLPIALGPDEPCAVVVLHGKLASGMDSAD